MDKTPKRIRKRIYLVNVEPPTQPPDLIPSFNPLIIIGIIGFISGISAIIIKKKEKIHLSISHFSHYKE